MRPACTAIDYHSLTSLAIHHKVRRLPLAELHTLSISVLALITLCPVASEVKLNRTKALDFVLCQQHIPIKLEDLF